MHLEPNNYFGRKRQRMVEDQLAARDVRDERVLEAMRTVPREQFVRAGLLEFAYADSALPIETGQTISQPYVVARMAELAELTPECRVLEIGAGSGYAAAVFSRIVREVIGVERHEALVRRAQARLATLGYDNVRIVESDGCLGWPDEAPYDAIIVSAGAQHVPPALRQQLVIGGRLVLPLASAMGTQRLTRIRRLGPEEFEDQTFGYVQFVPLVGGAPRAAGWLRCLRDECGEEVARVRDNAHV